MKILNVSGHDHCEWCENGLAGIGSRKEGHGEVAMYGPCPFCEQGAQKEYPERAGKNATLGPPRWWDGYWRGTQPHVDRPPPAGTLLSNTENHMRTLLLLRRWAGEQVDPLLGLELGERERLALLAQHMRQRQDPGDGDVPWLDNAAKHFPEPS